MSKKDEREFRDETLEFHYVNICHICSKPYIECDCCEMDIPKPKGYVGIHRMKATK